MMTEHSSLYPMCGRRDGQTGQNIMPTMSVVVGNLCVCVCVCVCGTYENSKETVFYTAFGPLLAQVFN